MWELYCIFSPVILVVLVIISICEHSKVIRLRKKIEMTDFPEIIKIKTEQHNQMKAKTELEIAKLIKEGKVSLKVPRLSLGNTARSLKGDYINLKISDCILLELSDRCTNCSIKCSLGI